MAEVPVEVAESKDRAEEQADGQMSSPTTPASRVVFYDVETTIPSASNREYHMIEFGAVPTRSELY